MAKAVSPSTTLSPGQITKLTDLLSAGLRKAKLPSDVSQRVIELQGEAIVKEFVAGFRQRVEMVSEQITCRVRVDRSRTPQQVLDATGRKQYTDRQVVDAMPRGEGEEVEVVFFKLGCYISDAELKKEFELRGLTPADPYSLATLNEADPAFADTHPNGTHWKDAEGKWCFATFNQWPVDGRLVGVGRDGGGWGGGWFFAGLRK